MTSDQLRDLAASPRLDADWVEAARIALLEGGKALEASERMLPESFELALILGD